MMKLYLLLSEEAIIRFSQLGTKENDVASLRQIQWQLGEQGRPFTGVDARIWGTCDSPQSYASDIIRLIEEPALSVMGKLLKDKALLWAPSMPKPLRTILFGHQGRKDSLRRYDMKSSRFEVASVLLGNISVSLLVYAAVTTLYFTTGKVGSVVAVLVIAGVTTLCSALFKNHQFLSILSTVCAVLVTLLLKNDPTPQPSRTSL
ncbi:hypothetical protein NX059_004068 [Plenodomus lindquistii]|nr:hypothetical protein NX059_004068 [Plenodomus lindquistii]